MALASRLHVFIPVHHEADRPKFVMLKTRRYMLMRGMMHQGETGHCAGTEGGLGGWGGGGE